MSFPRYPEYKESGVDWLGEVPLRWEVVQFKKFVDIQNGSDHKHVEQEEGFPVIGSGGVFAHASDFLYDGESVLLGRKGTIDKPLHINGRFWTVDTMYWTKISPAVSGRFAYYLAVTIPFDFYSTNTALPSMTKGALSSHRVACPPLLEQTQIAAFLDRETAKIDALIAEQRRLMELLKEKRQAAISHAVTQGLNPRAPMKPSGIEWLGDVPAHWFVTALKRGFSVTLGKMLQPDSSGPEDELHPYLRAANIQWDGVNSNDIKLMWHSKRDRAQLRLEHGDLLVSEGGDVGRSCLWAAELEQCYFQNSVNRVRARDGNSNRYLYYWMSTVKDKGYIDVLCNKSTIAHFTAEKVAAVPVPLPSPDEQAQIAAFLDREAAQIDGLTSEAQRAIDLLAERRTALISAAVTGQIDVRNVVAT
jgi:type I restriction enzyme S subunit